MSETNTEYLLQEIVKETNTYANQCMAKSPKRDGDNHLAYEKLTVPE